ncbi:hypothetical protein JCM10207_006296 [Rhodosporidiobolus poonsookiae]
MSTLQNYAAWLKEPHARLVVDEAPLYEPAEGEVLVKIHAVSIQPVDWKVQTFNYSIKEYPLKYPYILGTYSAGVVEAVGAGVTHVKKGDRILGYHVTMATQRPREGSFQHYAILRADLVSALPPTLSFENAAVLPLGLATAADALYQTDHLALPLPKPEAPNHEGKEKVLLVWGASSSVGSAAVQLAVASGLRVVATASPANFDFVKSLGASAVFDYRSSTIVKDLVAELQMQNEEFAGVFDAISEHGSSELCAEVASKVKGGNKFVVGTLAMPEVLPEGVKATYAMSPNVALKNGGALARAIYHDFVPRALETGALKCKPDPLLVEGKGLGVLQKAVDRAKEGVSARKVVARIN